MRMSRDLTLETLYLLSEYKTTNQTMLDNFYTINIIQNQPIITNGTTL